MNQQGVVLNISPDEFEETELKIPIFQPDYDILASKNQSLQKILAAYSITDQQDIDQANECLKMPQKWEAFLQDYIPPSLHKQFLTKLTAAGVLSSASSEKDVIFDAFNNLKKVPVKMSCLSVVPLKEYKWSQELIEQIHYLTQSKIEQYLKQSKNINQLFQNIIPDIFDLISRKGDLKEYFEEIKLSNQKQSFKSPLQKMLRLMSFTDFIILLIRSIQHSSQIGLLLSNLGLSVPFVYSIGEKVVFQEQICKSILGIDSYSLILNIGSQKAVKCGKTSFIAKLMKFHHEYSQASNFENIIKFNTKFNFSKDSNTILADFNGPFSQSLHPQIIQIIMKISKSSSLLIIHLREEELQEKILETQLYNKLCRYAPKILIYVRDWEKTGLKILNRCIPKAITQKTALRPLVNLKKQDNPMRIREELTFICSKSFNVFNEKRFSIQILYGQDKKKELMHYKQMIGQTMSEIERQDWTKRSVIPHIFYTEQLSEVTTKTKEQNESVERLTDFLNRQNEIKIEIKNQQLTSFVRKAIENISKDDESFELFSHRLYEWRREKAEPFRQRFLQLTQRLHNGKDQAQQIRQALQMNQISRMKYDITVDKIIHELILYNQHAKEQQYDEIITKYYTKCIKDIWPVNFIDGKTLQLGNSALQDYLKSLSSQYVALDKKIYVISVIGAQSSAKSTLLNFLLRCKFQTSAGRCTKGVYLSICELEQMVVVVLDTEGLLSISHRDFVFDHQIATLALRTSNLIIINNKGQLTSTLRQLLEVCLYVLECLHKDEKKTDYDPQAIIFALRDQTKPKGKFQEEMAAQIKNSLQQMKGQENLDYRNYFSIQTQDIFSFPNAFTQVQGLVSKTGTKVVFDKTFEKCIMGMRKRIVECLKESKPQRSLMQFYYEARNTWQTIQKCGKNIMNFRSVNEIVTRKKLQDKYHQKLNEFQLIIDNSFEQYSQRISSILQSSELNKPVYEEQFKSIGQKNIQIIFDLFQTYCDELCTNKQWIRSFRPKIQQLCRCYENSSRQKYKKKIMCLQIKEKDDQLKVELIKIITKLLQDNASQNVALQKFEKETELILSKFEQAKTKIRIQKYGLQVKQVLENILSSSKYTQLKINHIDQKSEKLSKKDFSKFVSTQNSIFINQKVVQNWLAIESKVNLSFESRIELFIAEKQVYLPSDIQKNFTHFLGIVQLQLKHLSKKTFELSNSFWLLKIQINENLYRIRQFSILFERLKNAMHSSAIKQHEQETDKYKKNIHQYKQNLLRIIMCRGNFRNTLENDISEFEKDFIAQRIDSFKYHLQNQLQRLSLRLNPEKIFAAGIERTLLKTDITSRKHHYLQCFKLVKNINRYLFEIMCQSPEISTRSVYLVEATNLVIQEVRNKLEDIIDTLQKWSRQQVHSLTFKQLLTSIKMIGLANTPKSEISDKKIIENLIKSLRQRQSLLKQQLVKQLKQRNYQKIMIGYIQGTLRGIIVGCQSCCPICGMKCMLQDGHSNGHRVLQNCHSMTAFTGSRKSQSKQVVVNHCQQKANILSAWRLNDDASFQNLKVFIDTNYPSWSSDFPGINEEHRFMKFADLTKFKRIWINIQTVLLKSKFKQTTTIPTKILEIKSLRDEEQLTEEDLERISVCPLTKKKCKLKDY